MSLLEERDKRRAVEWAADLCTCGCQRSAHKLGPRGPWPVSLRVIGPCTGCLCRAWELDTDALAVAEAALRTARLDSVRELVTLVRRY